MSTIRVGTISNAGGTQSTSAENVINGSAKAWVNFNGTGTVAIRQSYNVSSITDNGTGNYTVNLTSALTDANYSTVVNARRSNSDNNLAAGFSVSDTYTSSAFQIRTFFYNAPASYEDALAVYAGVFR
jgi:predicted PhzF superfamily epimerase YddE/YHI9